MVVQLKKRRGGGKAGAAGADEKPISELWDELKVISLTRLVSSVYGLVLLDLLLRLQMHVMARFAFAHNIKEGRKFLQDQAGESAAASESRWRLS